MNQSDIDEAIDYVEKIIDNVRCATCDRLEGSRMRYTCGHSSCEDCVIYAEDCPICTPPLQRSECRVKSDDPFTLVVKHARELLKACKDLFDVNAFQHKRISEQLKIEKELFPKCIQAPMKYENKRKSANFPFNNKENKYPNFFPGEAISTLKENKMENSVNYVQQWLNKSGKNINRKPFADLNVNSQSAKSPISRTKLSHTEGKTKSITRKRSHFKTTDHSYSQLCGNKKVFESECTPSKVPKKKYENHQIINVPTKSEHDESGIFLDNDPIVIDDSQESVIDKDKKAWLAVLEACKNENTQSTSLANCTDVKANSVLEKKEVYKVPFFKKSAITETCSYCKNEMAVAKPLPAVTPSKPVKITIDTDNFVTIITVFINEQSNAGLNTTSNVYVQTNDDSGYSNNDNCASPVQITNLMDDKSTGASDTHSEDLFADGKNIFKDSNLRKNNKCLVIEASDSDSDMEISGVMSVKADIHRSCQELDYGTLTEIVNVEHHDSKRRRAPRGHTPTSTDSSEKENYNPNRRRRQFPEKKKSFKK